MRVLTGFVAVAFAVALIGCDSSAPGAAGARPPAASGTVVATVSPATTGTPPFATQQSSSAGHASTADAGQSATSRPTAPAPSATEPNAVQPTPAGPKTSGSAREIAAKFDGLFFSGRFTASWDLLTGSAKQLISENLWVKVHEGCTPAAFAGARRVSSVTIFGDTAIIGETIVSPDSTRDMDHYLLSYANGRWAYSPDDMSIYHHGAVAADIAAARAAGFCGGLKVF